MRYPQRVRSTFLYGEGCNLATIAAEVGVSVAAVRDFLVAAGVHKVRRRDASAGEEEERLYLRGFSMKEVGERVGKSVSAVRYLLMSRGVERRKAVRRPAERKRSAISRLRPVDLDKVRGKGARFWRGRT